MKLIHLRDDREFVSAFRAWAVEPDCPGVNSGSTSTVPVILGKLLNLHFPNPPFLKDLL